MDAEVCAFILCLSVEAQPDRVTKSSVDQGRAHHCNYDSGEGTHDLAAQGHSAQSAQSREPEYSHRNCPHDATQSVKRPDAKHVIDLEAVLSEGEHLHKQEACEQSHHQRANGMHHITACTDGHEACQRPVIDEARVIASGCEGCEGSPDHGHEAIECYESRDRLNLLGTHDVKTKPSDDQDPAAQCKKGDTAWGCAATAPPDR